MFATLAIAIGCGALPIAGVADSRPLAIAELRPGKWSCRISVQIETDGEKTYSIQYEDESSSTDDVTRDMLLSRLIHANWLVDADGHFGIKVFGVRGKAGKVDPVKRLLIVGTKQQGRDPVKLRGLRGARVQFQEGKRKPGEKRPPPGPELGSEPFVEFDFTTMPDGNETDRGWRLKLEVMTSLKDLMFRSQRHAPNRGPPRETLCLSLAMGLEWAGFKAEVVDKSKVRVYGAVFDGRFYPATRGIVESPNLRPNELPKVTNPPTT